MNIKTILHCDVNNFYASVEMVKDPSLRGKPIAVSGDPEKRHGIILAKSYPAKACGIVTGEAIWEAKKKCPDLILVPADFQSYIKFSNAFFEIYTRYTDRVEPYGMDECWLDVTGSTHLFGSGEEIADTLRRIVNEELGLTISVGVSFTKSFAKLGSDMKKPDATTVIPYDSFRERIWNVPVGELIMVGRKTAAKLKKFNINTIGELANADRDLIKSALGIVGLQLVDTANGIEDTTVRHYYEQFLPKSVGHSTTTPRDMTTRDELKAVVCALSDQVAYRLRKLGLSAQGISLYTRNKDFEGFGRQMKLNIPSDSGRDIADAAMLLYDRVFPKGVPLRLAGVSAFNLVRNKDIMQTSFFDNDLMKKSRLDNSIDNLRDKYGKDIIKRGTVLTNIDITDIFEEEEFQPFKR